MSCACSLFLGTCSHFLFQIRHLEILAKDMHLMETRTFSFFSHFLLFLVAPLLESILDANPNKALKQFLV